MNPPITRTRSLRNNEHVHSTPGHLNVAISKTEAAALTKNEKCKPARTGIGVGIVAACLIALSSSQALAARASSYDIVEFSCSEEKDVGEAVELSIKVQKKGSSRTGTTLTLSGTQGGAGIFTDSQTILDARRNKEAEEEYLYSAVSAGDIEWVAMVDGDEAHCTTTVVHVGGDDDDDDGGGGTTSDNIIGLHDSGSPQYDDNCLECHAGIPTEESLDPGIHGAHMAMRDFVPGEDDEDKCVWCHRTVDLTASLLGPQPFDMTSANLRKHVDVRLCTACHGKPARATARQFYQVGLFPADPDGPVLYDLMCAACHRDLAQSEVRDKPAEEIASKIAENEGGMGPLNVLTAEEIQAIADVLAQQ